MQTKRTVPLSLATWRRQWLHLLLTGLLLAGGFALAPRPVAAQVTLTCVNKTTTDGLGANYVQGVYVSGSTVYAATAGGVSISTNGGATFTNKTTANGLGHNRVNGVYASGSTVYAATLNRLSISTDGGNTFTNKNTANGLGDNYVSGVYAEGSTVYAATGYRLSISTDSGATFTNKTRDNGLGSNTVWGVYVDGSTLYATTNGGLSISTNGGATFTNKTTANGLGHNNVSDVYASGSTVYAATGDIFGNGGLSISTNGGATFTNKTTANGLGSNSVYGVYVSGSTVYAATQSGLSISTDDGATFTNYTTANSLGHDVVNDVYANGSTIYAATYDGLSICTLAPLGPNVSVPTREQAVGADNKIQVPVQFDSKGKSVAATGFALNYDTTCLSFDPTDANTDGIPEAITGLDKLPAGFVASVNYDSTTKLLGVALYQPTPPITAKLSDGTLFTTTFTVQSSCIPSGIATKAVTVGFAATPKPSFGDAAGQDVSGSATNGTLTLYKNNAPTAIALSNSTVAENSAVGTQVGALSTTDSDTGDTFTYTLVSGTGSGGNVGFILSDNKLNTRASFDYEIDKSYSIRVRTTDKRGASFEQALTIQVTDVNEAPTMQALSNNTVDENLLAGATVGTFNTTDPDTTDNFTYELVSGDGSTDNASFTIVGGALQNNVALDYETKPSYTIRVRSTDKGALTTEQSFTISVNNVYEAPTGIANGGDGTSSDGSNATFDVNENVATGTTIATLAPANPDSGNSYTYELVSGDGSTDNATFAVVSGVLQTNAAIDYETKSSYSVRVRITDSRGATFEQALTILVNDLSEAPVAVDDVVDPRTTVFLGGVAGTIDVLVNDLLNAVGRTLSVAAITQPATGNGSVTNNTANVSYLAPASSNGSTTFTYQATNGNGNSNSATVAVTYVANDLRGDCNANGSLTAADFIATVLEIFDSSNSKGSDNQPAWWLIYTGTYAGSPRGCDANGSVNPLIEDGPQRQASVTAADIICTVRLFFGYACGAGVQAAQVGQTAHLAVTDAQATAGASTALTVNLNTEGNAIAAATFALILDPAALHFADTDADADGVPDAIALTVPAGMNKSVTWNAQAHRLEVAVFGMSLPLPTLSDGTLATVTVQVAADAPASTPLTLDLVTMSDPDGNDLTSTQANGTLTVQGGRTARTGVFLPLVAR